MPAQPYAKFTGHNNNFDAIVIGSGIGGITTSAILSKSGKKVLLLEKHYLIGGYTHTFQRKGYEWDTGLHYVGQVHIKGTPLNKVFRYISGGQLQWATMDNIYDKVIFGDKQYDFVSGRDNFKAKLKEYFPDEKDQKSIDDYFKLLDEINKIGIGYYAEKVLPPIISRILGPLLRRKTLKYSDKTTLSVLQQITNNKKLIGVLTAQYGDYGLSPAESSFYMHGLLVNHYIDGAGYPVGGATRIAETVTAEIENNNGTVLHSADVKKIIVKNNRAIGVEMADGKQIFANAIISDTGIINTFSQLLPAEVSQKHQLKEKLKHLTPSKAHIGLYAGFTKSSKELSLPACNFWIFPDEYDHEISQKNNKDITSEIPVAFVSFPSAKDPDSPKKQPDKSTAEVIIIVPFEWFSKWENTKWQHRGKEYEELKTAIADRLLEKIYQVQPQLKGHLEYMEVSTPLSTRNFMSHSKGEIYGIAPTPQRFRQTILKPHTPIKNLYLTGQDAMLLSISGALMGGVLCASVILKKDIFSKINRTIK